MEERGPAGDIDDFDLGSEFREQRVVDGAEDVRDRCSERDALVGRRFRFLHRFTPATVEDEMVIDRA
jgi:hypothetical protein